MKKITPFANFARGDKVNLNMSKDGIVVAEIPAVVESVSRGGSVSVLLASKISRNETVEIKAVPRLVSVSDISARYADFDHEGVISIADKPRSSRDNDNALSM